jgi:transcriptional regulator with XRE-family HTH domain
VAAGLSQSGLEARSGIPKARISRYENDHVAPSMPTLARLARSLDLSEAALLGDQAGILEHFVEVLASRGITIASRDQGRQLAIVIAGLVESAGGPERLAAQASAGPART